ncbi:MAG: ABC transporter ATP-binding protein [Candidatus Aenigmarchaeota archaeon]|nr:ABC transporter ATP-binding protein [Candidatus Aenigmarchaeota archaeon]
MEVLKIQDLHVKADSKKILKGVNLSVKKGEVIALLGPNASGKSTLAYTIMGLPEFKVEKGKIFFEGLEITHLKTFERAKLGISLAFQHPPQVRNVKLKDLLRRIQTRRIELSPLGLDGFSRLLGREVNVGFSGGERKISELLQLIAMNPKVVIFDEIDSGLDIQKLKLVTKIIKENFVDGTSVILITHRGSILRWIKPHRVAIMIEGKIVCESDDWEKVWGTIGRYGYEKCRECEVSPNRSSS